MNGPGHDGLPLVPDAEPDPPPLLTVDSPDHDAPGPADASCRLCRMRGALEETLARLPPLEGRQPLLAAVGLAVPAIEAW